MITMASSSDLSCWTYSGLIVISVLATGCFAESSNTDNSGSEGNGLELGLIIGGVASVVALVVAIALCVEKRVHVEFMDRGPPYWTRSLEFKQEFNGGLTSVSEGMNNLSPFHVIRDRLGQAVTDGARWDVGFIQGKHVFEVVWPVKKNRGTNSSIGVGSLQVPIKKQGRLSLVGHHSQSWGFDLSSRKMVNTNKKTGNFQKQFPDRFFMYVDMDGGKIGFGDDVKTLGQQALFYGNLVNNIRVDKSVPMYVMVGMCAPREEVQVYYIGTAIPQGGFSLVPPATMPAQQVVIYNNGAQPQQQQPGGYPQELIVQNPEPVPSTANY